MLNYNSSRIILVLLVTIYLPIAWYLQVSYYYTLFLIVTFIGLVVWGASFITSNFFIKAHCKGKTNEKVISITFDDGPNGTYTPLILEILKKHNIKATFFCIGKNISENIELATQIHNEGHVLGNHTYNHSYWFDLFPTGLVISEISKTSVAIKRIVGGWPNLFRPPYGVTTPNIARAVRSVSDLKIIGWSVRSLDTKKTEVQILKRVAKISPGDVILFHDTNQRTVNILEQYLQLVSEKGYQVVPLQELLDVGAYD
jgi:peptidoglycan/xylan/chitin deacetylase (PgdA/CDA1 family)